MEGFWRGKVTQAECGQSALSCRRKFPCERYYVVILLPTSGSLGIACSDWLAKRQGFRPGRYCFALTLREQIPIR